MSLFAEDAYTGPTTIFRSLSQLPLQTQEEEVGGGRGGILPGEGGHLHVASPPPPRGGCSPSQDAGLAPAGHPLEQLWAAACKPWVPSPQSSPGDSVPNCPIPPPHRLQRHPEMSRATAVTGVSVTIIRTHAIAAWHQAGLRAGRGSRDEAPHRLMHLHPCLQTPLLLCRHSSVSALWLSPS